jgi:hypothetical protein
MLTPANVENITKASLTNSPNMPKPLSVQVCGVGRAPVLELLVLDWQRLEHADRV